MDVNDIRIAVTLSSLGLFLVLMLHTYSRRRSAEHEAAAMLPFLDNSLDEATPDPQARVEGEVA